MGQRAGGRQRIKCTFSLREETGIKDTIELIGTARNRAEKKFMVTDIAIHTVVHEEDCSKFVL